MHKGLGGLDSSLQLSYTSSHFIQSLHLCITKHLFLYFLTEYICVFSLYVVPTLPTVFYYLCIFSSWFILLKARVQKVYSVPASHEWSNLHSFHVQGFNLFLNLKNCTVTYM